MNVRPEELIETIARQAIERERLLDRIEQLEGQLLAMADERVEPRPTTEREESQE